MGLRQTGFLRMSEGLIEVLQLLGGRSVCNQVYYHAIRAGLFFIHMLGLQEALGTLDGWMARFGKRT